VGFSVFKEIIKLPNLYPYLRRGESGERFLGKDYKYKEGKTNDNKKIGVRPSRKNKRKE
jgi:hypothetical protein